MTFKLLIVLKTATTGNLNVFLAEKRSVFCGKAMEKYLQKSVTIKEAVENHVFFCEKVLGQSGFQDSLISLIILSISNRKEGVALIFL